jgi:transposase
MAQKLYIREMTDSEREGIQAGIRSRESFVFKRCQILLASDRKESAPSIAHSVGCSDDTVHNVINGFNAKGLEVLKVRSRRPHKSSSAFTPKNADRLKEILHQSPRTFSKQTSRWTLDLAAEVSFENELTRERVSGETIRNTLKRLGVKWSRAKHWITSPDPEYAGKKTSRSADTSVDGAPRLGMGISG